MEAVDEIIDLDELQESIIDETLKDFISKDEDVAKLLKNKLDELSKEEEKLSSKEEEVKKLEESNREKISSNASADELIEIAGKLKEAEKELEEIRYNIKNLETEKEELIKTKSDIEKSKHEYVETLKSTNSNYEEQLKRISDAIEVCSNPALKQALEDVRKEKENELINLQEKRNNELNSVLNEYEEENNNPKVEINNIYSNVSEDNVLPLYPNTESDIVKLETSQDELDNVNNIDLSKTENLVNEESVINIDSILSKLQENEENYKPDLNVVNTDDLVLPDINISDLNNENKIKIIFEKNVPSTLLKDIFTSSKVMPALQDYLDNKGGN